MKKVVQDLTSGGIDWQREKWQSGLGSKFIHQGEKNAAKYADEVIVLSKGVQDYFKETYGRETHFMDNRDFESVEQMNEVMIEKWNKKVHARDEVVILGDLSLGNGKETNEILCRLKGRLCLIRGNHDERYLRDKEFDVSRFEWVRDYAEIHDNKRKIVLMHYPVFCYNGQFRRGADGTPLTYMLHGHIHKSEDQVLVDRFCTETKAMMRKSAHQETAQPVPCQMINCFCMYSDYMPLTLEEWIECDCRRISQRDCNGRE